MKKRRGIVFTIIFCCLVVLQGIIERYLTNTPYCSALTKKQTELITVEGLVATWEYIDRDISLDYFYNLDNTVTYKQIEAEIGKPNGNRGSGIVLPYYQIDDLYVVITFSLDKYGEYDKVGTMYLCTNTERLEQIYPR